MIAIPAALADELGLEIDAVGVLPSSDGFLDHVLARLPLLMKRAGMHSFDRLQRSSRLCLTPAEGALRVATILVFLNCLHQAALVKRIVNRVYLDVHEIVLKLLRHLIIIAKVGADLHAASDDRGRALALAKAGRLPVRVIFLLELQKIKLILLLLVVIIIVSGLHALSMADVVALGSVLLFAEEHREAVGDDRIARLVDAVAVLV